MTKHLTGVPPVSSTYCMTHDSHTRCRSSFRKSETSERPGTRNLETRECVLALALYTMTAGVALLVQGLRSSKRAISPQGTTPLSRKFGMPGSSTQHLIAGDRDDLGALTQDHLRGVGADVA